MNRTRVNVFIPFRAEAGIALPLALFMLLIMSSVSAIFYHMADSRLKLMTQTAMIKETFLTAEAALNEGIRRLSVQAHLWREKPVVSDVPANYTSYAPASYTSNNGIPTCSGSGCQRQMFPTGGGLLKNVGPIGGVGDSADDSVPITEQLNTESPGDADVTMSGENGWYQVERLDEVSLSGQNLGGSLDNNPEGGEGVVSVRYRLTGYSLKDMKGTTGRSTVIAVVEVPTT